MKILILAGTPDALTLAKRLKTHACVTLSYAAKPRRNVRSLCHRLETTPFCSALALRAYIVRHQIDLLIDATHPFARTISAYADQAPCRVVRIQRPAWEVLPQWQRAPTLQAAARMIPLQARVFWSLGRQGFEAIRGDISDIWSMTRVLEPPAPLGVDMCLFGRPGALHQEIAHLRIHAITHLVTKNAGGDLGYNKLLAAGALGVEVIIVNRPTYVRAPMTIQQIKTHFRIENSFAK